MNHQEPQEKVALISSMREYITSLLYAKREQLSISRGESAAKCRRVNLETVARINGSNSRFEAIAVRDPNFANFAESSSRGEHIAGVFIDESNAIFVGFDGTADQVYGQSAECVTVYGSSFYEAVGELNNRLGGNFCQRVIGPNSYTSL